MTNQKFHSMQEAVEYAIEHTPGGLYCTGKELAQRADLHYAGQWLIPVATAYTYRSLYRKKKNIVCDNRHRDERGVPRANQLNDKVATLEQVQRLVNYLKVQGNTFTSLLGLVGTDFHSIEQLRHTMETLKQLQVQLT